MLSTYAGQSRADLLDVLSQPVIAHWLYVSDDPVPIEQTSRNCRDGLQAK